MPRRDRPNYGQEQDDRQTKASAKRRRAPRPLPRAAQRDVTAAASRGRRVQGRRQWAPHPIVRHVAAAALAGVLVGVFWSSRPTWDGEMRLWKAVGDAAFGLLVLTLALGPLARLVRPAARLLETCARSGMRGLRTRRDIERTPREAWVPMPAAVLCSVSSRSPRRSGRKRRYRCRRAGTAARSAAGSRSQRCCTSGWSQVRLSACRAITRPVSTDNVCPKRREVGHWLRGHERPWLRRG
jgi:hypothetical protein